MSQYDLELDRIKNFIQENGCEKILVQLPEGLLDNPLKEVIQSLSLTGVKIFVSGDPSYGACDLATGIAKNLNCDLLIHFGHTNYSFESKIESALDFLDVMFVPAFYKTSIEKFHPQILQHLRKLNWTRIGLVATSQHLKNLEEIKNLLTSNDFEAVIHNKGQIIGCNVNNAYKIAESVDGIVSLHAGLFHSYGLILNTSTPIFQFNPYTGETKFFSKEEREVKIRKRYTKIDQARRALNWGILGSTKIGQFNSKQINRAEKLIQTSKKLSTTIIAENLNPQHLMNIRWIDAWVVTACPRLAIDDGIRFDKPVLTFKEFLYLFKEITWDELLVTGFF